MKTYVLEHEKRDEWWCRRQIQCGPVSRCGSRCNGRGERMMMREKVDGSRSGRIYVFAPLVSWSASQPASTGVGRRQRSMTRYRNITDPRSSDVGIQACVPGGIVDALNAYSMQSAAAVQWARPDTRGPCACHFAAGLELGCGQAASAGRHKKTIPLPLPRALSHRGGCSVQIEFLPSERRCVTRASSKQRSSCLAVGVDPRGPGPDDEPTFLHRLLVCASA